MNSMKSLIQYSHLGIVLVVMMFLGWYTGDTIGDYYHVNPVAGLLGFFFGFGAGLTYVVIEAQKVRTKMDESNEQSDH